MLEIVNGWGYSGQWQFMNIVSGICSVGFCMTVLNFFRLPRWPAVMAFIPMFALGNLIIIMATILQRRQKEIE